jgi:hypothetical protein
MQKPPSDLPPGPALPSRLEKIELEQQVIDTIRKHRRLVDAAQMVYEEWIASADDPEPSAVATSALQAQYVSRQRSVADHQDTLTEMLELLGYIPVIRD